MTFSAGTRLGPYEIEAPLGAGGMGEVYRARDPRLDRGVAVKVLPAEVLADPDRLRRFEQEARAAAALDHPNIVAVHDVGTHDGIPFVVSELLDGETLRARLDAGPLPLRKALDWGAQIARGLDAAHGRGIVHRDLKPENLFVTVDGRIKILDFGLAKLGGAALPGGATAAPTMTAGTAPGVVLGTVGYMAPEQVKGEAADHRADLFSAGAVLYEMLSGRRAFHGDSPVETLSAILKEEPPELGGSRPDLPPALDQVVRHCLEKRPEERFQSARDLAFALEALAGSGTSALRAATELARARPGGRALRAAGLAGGALAALLLGAAVGHRLARPEPLEPPSLRYLTSSGRDSQPAFSPDGRTLAFVSSRDGRQRIWLKHLTTGDEVALTEGPDSFPRFSPDGASLLFTRSEGQTASLFRAGVLGGSSYRLIKGAEQGDWSPDGERIAFSRSESVEGVVHSALGITSPDGGGERVLVRGENLFFHSPRWSDDGRTIALIENSAITIGAPGRIVTVDPEDGELRVLATTPRSILGTLVWNGGSLIYALPLSVVAATPASQLVALDVETGIQRPLVSFPTLALGVDVRGGVAAVELMASRANLREIPLRPRPAPSEGRWLTRGAGNDRQPVYSPDGEWLAFSSDRGGDLDLWATSTRSGELRRLTHDAAQDWDPGFTPDGRNLLWSSNRSGNFEIWIAEADGSGARQLTRDGVDAENPTSTPDGEWIVYSSSNPRAPGIWKIRRGGSEATRLVAGAAILPDTSPDGRYAVYIQQRGVLTVSEARVHAVRVADGQRPGFRIPLVLPEQPLPGLTYGRARWAPDGSAVLFVGVDAQGNAAILRQPFAPGGSAATPEVVLTSEAESLIESFGIAPDGSRITVSMREDLASLLLIEGLPDGR